MTLLFLLTSHLFALTQSVLLGGTLNGVVTDPAGALVDHAVVHVQGTTLRKDITTNREGRFLLDVSPGKYVVTVQSPGFEKYAVKNVVVRSGETLQLAIKLKIDVPTEAIDAMDSNATDPSANRSGLVLKGDQLAALADTDDAFRQQIIAMAGGSGIHAPEILIDGFSGGKFPTKNSVREVRINQNPFSAQYDSIGISRVEVFTKPGGEKFHGRATVGGNNDALNSRNPYTVSTPPYHSLYLDGNLGGPLAKATSFFANGTYNDVESIATVNATTLDSSLQPVAFTQAVSLPMVTSNYSFRVDRQMTKNNTLTARYDFDESDAKNSGVGLLVLPSQGVNTNTKMHTLRLSDTQLLGTAMVNEMRFQYLRTRARQTPADTSTTVIVQGAFSGGGSPQQGFTDNQDNYEFQNYFSAGLKSHFLYAGLRYRATRDANNSTANFNGMAVYQDLDAYERALRNPGAAGPSLYSITVGKSNATVVSGDISVYAEDDWKLRKDLTLSYGIRFESQSGIPDHFDPAPRVGVAWAVHQKANKPAWAVLRLGAGMFYDRFALSNMLTAVRQNGVTQQTYYARESSPVGQPTIYRVSPTLRSPSITVASISVDRSIPKLGSISVSYLWIDGKHQLLSRNINAPVNGVRPLGGSGDLYQFSSEGNMRQRIFFFNANMNAMKKLSMFAFGAVQSQRTDAGGATVFASNQYNIRMDYGRVADPMYQFYTGGWFHLPRGFDVGPFLALRGGAHFNITTGSDINQDTQFNDRPAFATDLMRPSVVKTAFGNFDTAPLASQQIIPINYGSAPNFVALQLQATKVFKLGPKRDEKGTRPYALGFTVDAQNVLNHRNPGTPVGVLSSPLFGQSISLAAAADGSGNASRVINLRGYFSF